MGYASAFEKTIFKQINTYQLKEEYFTNKEGKMFIDVRTVHEYKANGLKEFENIPLQELEVHLNKIPKDKEVVLICRSGARSLTACQILAQNGFKEVTNVTGGMNAWFYF